MRMDHVFGSVIAGFLILFNMVGVMRQSMDKDKPTPWIDYYGAADWIRDNTKPDAVVACRKPELLELMCKRKSVLYPWLPAQAMVDSMAAVGVTHVVVDNLAFGSLKRFLRPAVFDKLECFRIVAISKTVKQMKGGEPMWGQTWVCELHPEGAEQLLIKDIPRF